MTARERRSCARAAGGASVRATRRTTATPTGSTTPRRGSRIRSDRDAPRVRALSMVRLDRDVYQMGLRGTIDPAEQPELAAAHPRGAPRPGRAPPGPAGRGAWSRCSIRSDTIPTRRSPRTCCSARRSARPSRSTISRRIPTSSGSSIRRAHTTLAGVGLELANTMVELFADLPPDHEYFTQYSFIGSDDLPELQAADRPGRRQPARRVEPERPRAPDLADLQADPGAPSPGPGRRRAAGAGPRGAAPVPRAAARRTRRRDLVLRPRRTTPSAPAFRTTSCSARSPTARPRRPSGSAS